MTWYPRTCTGCGVQLVASTDDPDVQVMCMACDPSDLPVYVDPERERKMRGAGRPWWRPDETEAPDVR